MPGASRASRVAIAAAILVVLLAALLGAWFVTGWSDVRARQAATETAPIAAASARAGELARQLRGELDQLVEREAKRPYFQYQNLFHDPRASAGWSVTPSPLASGPDDPLVLGYFQIDSDEHVTTPAINDEFPQLSDLKHLVEQKAFRDQVAQLFAHQLAPERMAVTKNVQVAKLDPPAVHRPHPTARPRGTTREAAHDGTSTGSNAGSNATTNATTIASVQSFTNAAQTVQFDPGTYAQNSNANAVYGAGTRTIGEPAGSGESVGSGAKGGTDGESAPGGPPTGTPTVAATPTGSPSTHRDPVPPIVHVPEHTTAPSAPVTISISPLEWKTLPFTAGPALVAVRQVATPDGNLAQGFIVDRTALTQWLAAHDDDLVAELRTGTGADSELAPGWELVVHPNPRTVAAAAHDAASIATGFIVRFLAIGAIALVAALLLVWLVARTERYARERSQFAAAAAHELRTPLAGLQLYGDMLADGLGDPNKLRDYARRMSEEASRLGRVVSNVLGFSQLERGNLSIDPKPGDVATALRELVEHAQPALDRSGAMLALDAPEQLTARFDRDALARIVGNLVDNAEKYSRDATDRTIELTARTAGERVEISVRDHGAGVSDPAKLFQAFARGVDADGPAGLGLGLALSRSLAREMGGELELRAVEGGGALFVLRLARA
jgi:signal transduction histidine kinase